MSASMAELLSLHYPMPLHDGGFKCASFECKAEHSGFDQAIFLKREPLIHKGGKP